MTMFLIGLAVGVVAMQFLLVFLNWAGVVDFDNEKVMYAVCFVPVIPVFVIGCLWMYVSGFFKLLIKGVEQEKFDRLLSVKAEKDRAIHLFGSVYFWRDEKAVRRGNKNFLLRVKKPRA